MIKREAMIPKHKSVFLQFNSADIGSGKQEMAFAAFADCVVFLY